MEHGITKMAANLGNLDLLVSPKSKRTSITLSTINNKENINK